MSLRSGLLPASDIRGQFAVSRPWRAPVLDTIAFRYAIGWV
ncbi:hypothetical protein [Streptomyces sp. NPDC051776]